MPRVAVLAVSIGLVVATFGAPSAFAAGRAPAAVNVSPEVDAAQASYDAAQKAVHDAADTYSDVLTGYLQLGRTLKATVAEHDTVRIAITRNTTQVTSTQAARTKVNQRLRLRARDLYIRGGDADLRVIDAVLEARSPVEAQRFARMTSSVASGELALQRTLDARLARLAKEGDALTTRDSELTAREVDLTAQRDTTRVELERLDAAERAEEAKLAAATNDLRMQQWMLLVAIATSDGSEGAGGIPPPPEIVSAPSHPRAIPDGDGPCPISGPLNFRDDFGDPRSSGRHHQGQDLFNARGTPNVAVAEGTIIQQTGGLGGLAVWLDAADGTRYYYAHLESFAGAPRAVHLGDVIGYTGDTGNALGGATHTHFEVHPGGGPAVDPFPLLRAWCGDAAAGIFPPTP